MWQEVQASSLKIFLAASLSPGSHDQLSFSSLKLTSLALALKYSDQAGRDGELVTGKAPKQQGDVFNSQQEMVEAMNDPKYHDDPAYRDALMEKLSRSDINF